MLCFVSVLVPGIISNNILNNAAALHTIWLAKTADPLADVAELTAGARDVWLAVTKAYYYESVTFGSEYDHHQCQKALC